MDVSNHKLSTDRPTPIYGVMHHRLRTSHALSHGSQPPSKPFQPITSMRESVRARSRSMKDRCEQKIVQLADKHFDIPGLVGPSGSIVHITDIPAGHSRASIFCSITEMLEWYHNHPGAGNRPCFSNPAPVNLLDDICPESPNSFEQYTRFPALTPTTNTVTNPHVTEVHDELLNEVLLQRERTLEYLEMEDLQSNSKCTPSAIDGVLIDLNDTDIQKDDSALDEKPYIHPDLVSLLATSSPAITVAKTSDKIVADGSLRAREHAVPPKAKPYLGVRSISASESTTVRTSGDLPGPLPESLRIARLEALNPVPKQKRVAAVSCNESRYTAKDGRTCFRKSVPASSLVKEVYLDKPLPPLPPSNLCVRVLQGDPIADLCGRSQESVEQPHHERLSKSSKRYALDGPHPGPPPRYIPYHRYTAYRPPMRANPTQTASTNTQPLRNPHTQSPLLAHSQTIVRQGTLHQMGGRVIDIPNRRTLKPVIPARSSSRPLPQPGSSTSTHNEMVRASNSVRPSVAQIVQSYAAQSEADENVDATAATIGRGPHEKFAWREFSHSEFVDPAREWSASRKLRRMKHKTLDQQQPTSA